MPNFQPFCSLSHKVIVCTRCAHFVHRDPVHNLCTPCALPVHSLCTACALPVHSFCTRCTLCSLVQPLCTQLCFTVNIKRAVRAKNQMLEMKCLSCCAPKKSIQLVYWIRLHRSRCGYGKKHLKIFILHSSYTQIHVTSQISWRTRFIRVNEQT